MNSIINCLKKWLGVDLKEMSEAIGIPMIDLANTIVDVTNADPNTLKKIIIFLDAKFTNCETPKKKVSLNKG